MDNERLKREIIYGKVHVINKEGIIIEDLESDRISWFDMSTTDDDYSDLYEGEEVIVLSYTYTWSNDSTKEIKGIVAKSRYDNAVRDSQGLPKGWLHEPIFKEKEIHGVVLDRTENTITYMPDLENKPRTINTSDYSRLPYISIDDDIVDYEHICILPDNRIISKKQLYHEKVFNKTVQRKR